MVVALLEQAMMDWPHCGWNVMFLTTMLHCGTPSGLMIPRIPKPTGATLSLWAPQREISMPCGMHATTSLGSTPVGVMKRNPSAPFPTTSTSSACKCPPDNPNAFTPVAFYSHETHYSIMKAMNMKGDF